jgi:Cu/Ag efflux protein CusF
MIKVIPMNPRRYALALLCLCALLECAACNPQAPPPAAQTQAGAKRYSLKGKVISVDKRAGNASIYNEPIPGFMDPMAMPYAVHPAALLDQLQPGDTIAADVVVAPDKYWLENVKVVAHSQPPAEKSPATPEKAKKE